MAYIQVKLSGDDYEILCNKARRAGVSPSTMLSFLLDKGDNHPSRRRTKRQNFLRRGDNHPCISKEPK